MGSKFLINYLHQKWWYLPFLFANVNLYWVCGGAKYTVQMWTSNWSTLLLLLLLLLLRLANRPGMAGIIPECTYGVPCPGRGSLCPGNVKIDHRAWIYGCSIMSVLYFVLFVWQSHTIWLDFALRLTIAIAKQFCACTEIYIYSYENTQKLLPPELLLLTQICTKSFVGWGFAPDLTGGAYQWCTEGGGLEPPHWRVKKNLIGLLQPHSSDRHSKADPKQELRIQCI